MALYFASGFDLPPLITPISFFPRIRGKMKKGGAVRSDREIFDIPLVIFRDTGIEGAQ
jgi:hypothetical protein